MNGERSVDPAPLRDDGPTRIIGHMIALLVASGCVYGPSMFIARAERNPSLRIDLGMSTADALTVIAIAGAIVVALRSWIRRPETDPMSSRGATRMVLMRSYLSAISGLLAVLAAFGCLAESAPETVEVGAIITLVFALIVALIAGDTAAAVPTYVLEKHREVGLRHERKNLMRAYLYWSAGKSARSRQRARVFAAVACVRSALLVGGLGAGTFELVESRDGSWNSASDVIGDIGGLAVVALLIMILSLLVLRAWALSDWSSLAITTIYLVMFVGFLALAWVETMTTTESTLGWAVGAGLLTSCAVVGVQLWVVCKRSRSVLLSWVAPTAYCSVIARAALQAMNRRDRQIAGFDAPNRGTPRGRLRASLRRMRGIDPPLSREAGTAVGGHS